MSAENEDGEPARPVLSDAAITAAGEALRVAAPNSEIMLDFACPHCGETSVLLFDPLTHVWSEIEVAARRAFLDVHGLASAYGWTESEILALSPARRRHYLELAGE